MTYIWLVTTVGFVVAIGKFVPTQWQKPACFCAPVVALLLYLLLDVRLTSTLIAKIF